MNNELSAAPDELTLMGGGQEVARMLDMIFGHAVAQVVRCAALFSFADHLASGPVRAEDIARTEHLDAEGTVRLLRACAAFGLATFDPDSGFEETPLLDMLRKDDPRRLRDMAIVQTRQVHWLPWGRLDETIRNGRSNFQAGHAIWDYFATPVGAAEGEAMLRYLDGISGVVAEEVARVLDLREVKSAADIGGASGSLVSALLRAKPSLEGIVFDLPQVAAQAAKAAQTWGLSERLKFYRGGFLRRRADR